MVKTYGGDSMHKNHLLFTLFGATGDLAARKLYPAIYRLYLNGHLSDNFALIGTARREWSHDHFRSVVLNSIQSLVTDEAHAQQFISHFYYQPHDVQDKEHYIRLKNLADSLDKEYDLRGNRIFYMSTSPRFFPIISKNLKEEALLSTNGFNRLIIEKPFGHNLDSATQLQSDLNEVFDESQIYRIDHYLGKEIVQAIYNMRFDNTLFKHNWQKDSIDNVQITLAETVGVEERAEYYDTSGVTRDMIQNHALQMLALIAMAQPENNTPEAIQQEKIKVLNSIQLYSSLEEVEQHVVRAQYSSHCDLVGYRQEDKVNPESVTETFFAAEIHLNLPQWEGVPFYIRSGKRMSRKTTLIDIQFKPARPNLKKEHLCFEVAPNLGYELWLNAKKIGTNNTSTLIPFRHYYTDEELVSSPDDYERLIGECIDGDKSHFAHWEEVAAAWRYIDHIHTFWAQQNATEIPLYYACTEGPEEANALLKKTGRKWKKLR